MRIPLWLEWSWKSLICRMQCQLQQKESLALSFYVYLYVFVSNIVESVLGSFVMMLRIRQLFQALRWLPWKGWNLAACLQVPLNSPITSVKPQGLHPASLWKAWDHLGILTIIFGILFCPDLFFSGYVFSASKPFLICNELTLFHANKTGLCCAGDTCLTHVTTLPNSSSLHCSFFPSESSSS